MPSIIASKIYNLIQAKSFQYIDYVADTKKKNDSETIETEKWNKGNKRKRSNESFYFNNHDFFKLGKGIKYNFDSVECTEFEKAYSGYINNRISSENRLPAEAQKATDFLPQAQAITDFLPQAQAATDFFPQAQKATDFLPQAQKATDFLPQAQAATDFLPQAQAATDFLPQAQVQETINKRAQYMWNLHPAKKICLKPSTTNYLIDSGSITLKVPNKSFTIDEVFFENCIDTFNQKAQSKSV